MSNIFKIVMMSFLLLGTVHAENPPISPCECDPCHCSHETKAKACKCKNCKCATKKAGN